MLVYGLQKQQCEKHFRRIHPSLNVVVSRSPFLPLFPRTQFLGIAPLQNLAKKNERTFIFHFSIITDPEETNSKAAEKEPVLHSHSLTQSSRDPTVGARNQKGKLHRLFGCSTSTLSPLCAAPYSVHQHFCTISIESTIVSRRGGQQQHRITFTQRDFGIVGRTSKKEQKSSLNSTRRRRELTVVRIEHENREAFGGESAERT